MEKTTKILFIDREHGEYLLIADILAHVHLVEYELTWCNQLETALPKILSQEYDVVLLDYYWGDQNARDLLNSARVQACQTPIVVMTDEMETEVDREAIRAGASDYMIKGQIDSQLLERTLRYAIERKQTELHLARLAHYDPLTDIPNRILFRDRLEHAIRLAERDKTLFSLMFIDLNGFKQVNDTYGHGAGDEVLRELSHRIEAQVRGSDVAARYGGEEFVILLPHTGVEAGKLLAERIRNAVSTSPVVFGDGKELTITASIGIASAAPQEGDFDLKTLGESLIARADVALYSAKSAGRNRIVVSDT